MFSNKPVRDKTGKERVWNDWLADKRNRKSQSGVQMALVIDSGSMMLLKRDYVKSEIPPMIILEHYRLNFFKPARFSIFQGTVFKIHILLLIKIKNKVMLVSQRWEKKW